MSYGRLTNSSLFLGSSVGRADGCKFTEGKFIPSAVKSGVRGQVTSAHVSSFHEKSWLKQRVNSGKPQYLCGAILSQALNREGAETRHSLPKSNEHLLYENL